MTSNGLRAGVLEVVAPVGKRAALAAAVCNGADAVYFGLGDFNARKRAENFKIEDIGGVVEWLHRRNVKAYITLNTLVFSDELEEAKRYIIAVADAGVDGVIVQDLGVARMVKAVAPEVKIHASTQMSLTETGGIELVKELGIARVVLARELSIEEVKRVAAGTKVELEVFVHGAMCISYSGQCLGSLLMLGRSANRGVCGQPCRMVYDVVAGGKTVKTAGRYVLSPRDLAAYEHVKELAAAGVTAMKIEGRMKNEYYVAAATAVYRKMADAAAEGRDAEVSNQEKETLLQTFSRGFSSGFLKGKNHQELVHAQFGKNRGMLVGEVAGTAYSGQRTADRKKGGRDSEWVKVRLFDEYAGRDVLMAGYGVVFDDGLDEQGGRIHNVEEVGKRKHEYRNSKSETIADKSQISNLKGREEGVVILRFGRGDVDAKRVSKGALVWKTDDPGMKKRLEATWAKDQGYRKEKVMVTIYAQKGKRLRVEMRDRSGNAAMVEGQAELEAARSRPLTIEAAREQFSRLGGTPFELEDVQAGAMEDVMVPVSVLNAARREAVERLIEKRETRNSKSEIRDKAQIANVQMSETKEADGERLSVVVRTMEQVEAVAEWNARNAQKRVWRVYGCFEDSEENTRFVKYVKEAGMSAGLVTPQVIKPGEEWVLQELAGCGVDAILARNLAAMAFFRGKGIEVIADASLNAVNEMSAETLLGWGAARVTFGADAAAGQLRAMATRSSGGWYEAVVYGHSPMFHTEHCLFAARLSDGRDEKDCGRPCLAHGGRADTGVRPYIAARTSSRMQLRDLKGRSYDVGRDRMCRNTVYAAGAWREKEYLKAVREAGVGNLRVELLNEGREEISSILDFGF